MNHFDIQINQDSRFDYYSVGPRSIDCKLGEIITLELTKLSKGEYQLCFYWYCNRAGSMSLTLYHPYRIVLFLFMHRRKWHSNIHQLAPHILSSIKNSPTDTSFFSILFRHLRTAVAGYGLEFDTCTRAI